MSVKPGRPASSPIEAMESVLRPALRRTPCVVGFSGGRDSSAVLAVAVGLARREGLPLPLPVTNVFPGVPSADETQWQEMVVRHLGLSEWTRLHFDDELDLLGPTATASLRRHGVLWPGTLHIKQPQIEMARGGCYVDGEGGDEILGPLRAAPLAQVARGELPRSRRAAKNLMKAVAVTPVRRRFADRRTRKQLPRPWLRPAAEEWFFRTSVDNEMRQPLRYGPGFREILRRRAFKHCFGNLDVLGRSLGVEYVHPLMDPGFVDALGRTGGWWGYPDRTGTMRAVFADLLPDAILARPTKVYFNDAFVKHHSRAFVEQWDGSGVDLDLVDPDKLRKVWQEPLFHGGTFQLLHSVWLASQSARPPATAR